MKKFNDFLKQTLDAGQIQIIDYDNNRYSSNFSDEDENEYLNKLKKCYKILSKDTEKANSFIKQFEDGEYKHILPFMEDFINAVNSVLDDKDKIDDISKKEVIDIYNNAVHRRFKSRELRDLFKILFNKYEYLKKLEQNTQKKGQEEKQEHTEETDSKQSEEKNDDFMKSSIGNFNLNDVFESRYNEIMSEYIINEDRLKLGQIKDKIHDVKNVMVRKIQNILTNENQIKPKSPNEMTNILTIYADNSYDVFGDNLFDKVTGSDSVEFMKNYFSELYSYISGFTILMKSGDQKTDEELNNETSEEIKDLFDLIDSITELSTGVWEIKRYDQFKDDNIIKKNGITKDEGKELAEALAKEYSVDLSTITGLDETKTELKKGIDNKKDKIKDIKIKNADELKQRFQNLNKHDSGKLVYYFNWFLTFLQHLDKVKDSTFKTIYENILKVDSELSDKIKKKNEEGESKEASDKFIHIIRAYFKAFINERLSKITDSFYTDLTKKYMKIDDPTKRVISRTRFCKNFIRYVVQGVCDQDINTIQQLLKKSDSINKKWLEEKYIKYFTQVMLDNDTINGILKLKEFNEFFDEYITSTEGDISEK